MKTSPIINFVTYLGFTEPDVVSFSGREQLYKKLCELDAVIHPNKHDTFLFTEKLTNAIILEIINETLEAIEVKNYENELEPISGGFLLQFGNEFIIPQCCTDLKDAELWKEVLENPATNWTQIWIGHPWIFYKTDQKQIHFSNYTEKTQDDFEIIPI